MKTDQDRRKRLRERAELDLLSPATRRRARDTLDLLDDLEDVMPVLAVACVHCGVFAAESEDGESCHWCHHKALVHGGALARCSCSRAQILPAELIARLDASA